MNISHIGTVTDRIGTGPMNASWALSRASTPTTRGPATHRGRSRTCVRYIASAVALLAFTGCASQPVQVDSAATAKSAQSPSEVAIPAAAPVAQSPQTRNEGSSLASALNAENQVEAADLAAAAAGMPAEGTDQFAANLAKARKLGYRIVNKNGENVYCSESIATGSHVNKRTICLTEKQWNDVSMNTERAMERMQKNTFPCPAGYKNGGCGG